MPTLSKTLLASAAGIPALVASAGAAAATADPQFARSGVEIDSSQRMIAVLVPAHGRLRVQAFEIGRVNPQASSSGCRVVGVTPA
jgi:hypothetical protein